MLKAKNGLELGTVKWFNQENGYGFITDAAGRDIYFRQESQRYVYRSEDRVTPFFVESHTAGELLTGTKVLFLREETSRGIKARMWGLCPRWFEEGNSPNTVLPDQVAATMITEIVENPTKQPKTKKQRKLRLAAVA